MWDLYENGKPQFSVVDHSFYQLIFIHHRKFDFILNHMGCSIFRNMLNIVIDHNENRNIFHLNSEIQANRGTCIKLLSWTKKASVRKCEAVFFFSMRSFYFVVHSFAPFAVNHLKCRICISIAFFDLNWFMKKKNKNRPHSQSIACNRFVSNTYKRLFKICLATSPNFYIPFEFVQCELIKRTHSLHGRDTQYTIISIPVSYAFVDFDLFLRKQKIQTK